MKRVNLGRRAYGDIEAQMRSFTLARTPQTPDELWLVEHEPVFTQGLAGRPDHILESADIPIVQTQRGGQVTYHGPGQVTAYPLVDLRRRNIYVKEYVFRLETAVVQVLADLGVTGHRVPGAPGIYVRLADPADHTRLRPALPAADPFVGLGKVAALGIKVSNHCAYHGLALNVAMDLRPYDCINPCGYAGLRSIDLRSLGVSLSWQEAADRLAARLDALLAV
jgi:lipoyl(octanoyl) transferase